MKDLNISPYYSSFKDDYDTKNYKNVLFRPGRAVQARELTDIQFLLLKQLEQNFNTLYKNGSIVEGLDLTISEVESVYTVYMSAGKFYFEGRILSVEEQSIVIDGTGDEDLGLFVYEEFIRYTTDSTLTDPANGYSNYSLNGADRLKITVTLVKVLPVVSPKLTLPDNEKYADDENVNLIWNLTDAVVQNYIRKPDYSLITQTLAKRTFDESGHYLVEGMNLSTSKAYDDTKIKVVVNPGTCYVKGFDNTFIVPQYVDVIKSLTLEAHANEPHTYQDTSAYYELIYPYVSTDEDISIIAIIEVSTTLTRGTGDYDTIIDIYAVTYESIESIISIPGYILNTDYELSNDQVHWLLSKPSGGSDYSITFRYYKDSVRDTDFTVSLNPYSNVSTYSVIWLGVDDPADDTVFLVDYSTYQARTDLISIDKNGYINVKSGIPTDYDETKIPMFNNEMLPLGWIKFFPGEDYDSCQIYEYLFKRTTMYELHNIKKRVTDLEENVAVLALEREVKEGEDSTALKGMLVDAFNSLYQADVSHASYTASTNLVSQELVMTSLEKIVDLNRNNDTKTNIKTWTDEHGNVKYFTLNYTTTNAFFSQELKSDTMNLNPFGFIKNSPFAKLTPPSDSWIDTVVKERTIINNQIIETNTTKHQLQWVSNPTAIQQLVEEKITSIGEKASTQKVEIGDKLITHARTTTIVIQGSNFEPVSHLTCICAGIYVPLTAVFPYRNSTSGGNSTGKIIVASNGTFKATFKIPPNTKSGDIEIKLIDEHNNIFTTVFKSKGVQKIIENRTVITKNFEKNIDVFEIIVPPKAPTINIPVQPTPPVIIPNPEIETPIPEPAEPIEPPEKRERIDITYDPLAQSFIFKEDKVIVAIDLWFATKADDTDKPVIEDDYYNTTAFQPIIPANLTIGYMKNGFPDAKHVLHIQEVYPENINTSLYGYNTPTNIVLTKPIYIPAMKDFFVSIGSKSTEYTVYVAVLGETDLSTGNVIMKQAYQDGSLFTSSNGITWTPVQERDLAIKLYEGVYSTTGSIITENITYPYGGWTGYGRFLFMNDFVDVPDTDVVYYYSTDGGTTYKNFNPSDEISFDAGMTQLRFKIAFSTAITSLSSIVHYTTNLVFFKYDISTVGQYRTKLTEDVPAYNTVKLIIDENTPSTTSINKEFSGDNVIWFRFVQDAVDSVDIGRNFYKNTYLFQYDLLQKLTVSSSTGFAVGDDVKYVGSTPDTAKITSIVSNDIYVILNSDGVTRFNDGHTLTNGVTSIAIDTAEDFNSEPAYPVMWCGRLLLESTSYWRSPTIKNYRSIFKLI